MTESKKIDVVKHLAIMIDEFDKIISLTNSLEEISKEEIFLEDLKKIIKDFSLKVKEITRVYTISEQKLVEYLKIEKDSKK